MAHARRWWLPPRALALLSVVLGLLAVAGLGTLWVWGQPPPDDTVWVQLVPHAGPDLRGGTGAKGVVVVAVKGARVGDPGPFAERVAGLVAPAAPRLPAVVHEDLDGTVPSVDVHLTEPLVPRRLDTQAVQRALAAAGFRWLVVGLYVQERSQVLPPSAAEAGECWGDDGLSCEWRIATTGPPLRLEVRPVPSAQGQP